MTFCFDWLPAPIEVGAAAFTSSAAVFGLLAALSNTYEIAPIFDLLSAGKLRRLLLFMLAGNAGLGLFHPTASALFLVLILIFLADRIVRTKGVEEDRKKATSAVEEEVEADLDAEAASSAIEGEMSGQQS